MSDETEAVSYFLDDMRYHGKTERTRAAYRRVLRQFSSFLSEGSPRDTTTPAEATHRDCIAWIHTLRGSHSESTVATYASYLHRFYAYMTQVGELSENPMTLVMEEMDESIDSNPSRRDLSVPQMRTFLSTITHPLDRAVFLTLLKTGMRVGELCNLDLRDVSVDQIQAFHPITVRPQLDHKPDSIFISADPSVDKVTNGEQRSASNKRKRDTIIPVDQELRMALLRWVAIRPDPVSAAQPLFTSTANSWGERLTPHMVHHMVERHASENDWHRTGGGASENVTPHYFRHFFTTHLRDRTGDRGIVKYLRGDVADDIIDTYTHNWGDKVRDTYEANIYRLLE